MTTADRIEKSYSLVTMQMIVASRRSVDYTATNEVVTFTFSDNSVLAFGVGKLYRTKKIVNHANIYARVSTVEAMGSVNGN